MTDFRDSAKGSCPATARGGFFCVRLSRFDGFGVACRLENDGCLIGFPPPAAVCRPGREAVKPKSLARLNGLPLSAAPYASGRILPVR
jgi:hypothetical protein